jgi:hypothetical protein
MRSAVHVRLRSAEEVLDEPASQPPRDARMTFAFGIGRLYAPDDLHEIDVIDKESQIRFALRPLELPNRTQPLDRHQDRRLTPVRARAPL